MTRARRLSLLFAATFVALTLIGRADQSRDEIALRAAIETETIKGDLKSAVAQFQKLSTSADRTVAATALLHLAGCYRKLGQADARRVYEDIIERFKDQPDLVAEANRKLATSNGAASASSLRLLASRRDDRVYGYSVSRNGRYVPFISHDRLNVLTSPLAKIVLSSEHRRRIRPDNASDCTGWAIGRLHFQQPTTSRQSRQCGRFARPAGQTFRACGPTTRPCHGRFSGVQHPFPSPVSTHVAV